MNEKKRGYLALGIVIGLVVGFVGTSLGASFLAHLYLDREARNVRRGWDLVPVVVADRDMEANTVVTFDDIAKRQVPDQFVTTSVIKPSDVDEIVEHKLGASVKKGEPLLWMHFGISGDLRQR
jgi:pilus assembly protein CpaB